MKLEHAAVSFDIMDTVGIVPKDCWGDNESERLVNTTLLLEWAEKVDEMTDDGEAVDIRLGESNSLVATKEVDEDSDEPFVGIAVAGIVREDSA